MLNLRKIPLPPLLLANIAIIITVIAWGTSFISTKIILHEMPPSTLAFTRFFIASLLLYGLLKKLEPQTKIAPRDHRSFFIAGFLGIALYFFMENTGIKFTTASNASLITAFVPLLTIATNFIFFRVKLSLCEWLGIILGTAGAYLTVTANGQLDFSSDNFKGNLFLIGAMLAWAAYTIFCKRLQNRYSGLAVVAYQTFYGTLALLPMALLEYTEWQAVSLISWFNIAYLAFICSAAGYVFYSYSLKVLDVTVTIMYLNLVQVFGVGAGYLILNERLLPIQLWGGLLIFISIFISNLNNILKLFHKHERN